MNVSDSRKRFILEWLPTWLNEDEIHPWRYRSWLFPRDPHFVEKAGRILDLYEPRWQEKPLSEDDFPISADEKTSIQARRRLHASLPTRPDLTMRIEHEYERCGSWTYTDVLSSSTSTSCQQHSTRMPW